MPLNNNNKTLIHYVPHGINSDIFKPLPNDHKQLIEGKKQFFKGNSYDYVIFFNSRNTKRKQISNLILGYKLFCDNLPKEQSKKCALILHTEIIGQHGHGTDLIAVKEAICKEYTVYFSQHKITPDEMNLMYNLSDVTVGVSSNEGFGLSIAESIMAGTPVIVNVTGGLQDQIGQMDDEGKPVEFNREFGTNSIGRYKKHGIWAKPIWPSVLDVHGSVQTPYIFDDMVKIEDISNALMYWYLISPSERERCGNEGRRWAMNEGGLNAKNMCDQFIKSMDYTLANFKKASSFSLHTSDEFITQIQPNESIGVKFPPIDIQQIKNEIEYIK
jgi:glycosyltransferase involved in cell wall biosynthesis